RAPRRRLRAARAPSGTSCMAPDAPRIHGRRPDRARRARKQRSNRGCSVTPCDLLRLAQDLPQARQSGEHPALDRSDRLSKLLGELRLREAAVVREIERLTLRVRQLLLRALLVIDLETKSRHLSTTA